MTTDALAAIRAELDQRAADGLEVMARSPYAPGRYEVWVNTSGQLHYQEVTP